MATRRPAGSARQESRVIPGADEDPATDELLLEMALQAGGLIAIDQHLGVDRPVRLMTRRATLADGLVLEHKRAALRGVTFPAGVDLRDLRRPAADHSRALVRIVTVRAAHFALDHRMVGRQGEGGPFVEMALEAGFRRFPRVDDGAGGTTGFLVDAARTVAGFTPDVHGVRPGSLHSGVVGGREILHDLGMAFSAAFRTGELGPGDLRRRYQGPIGGARNGRHRKQDSTQADAEPDERGPSRRREGRWFVFRLDGVHNRKNSNIGPVTTDRC